MKPLRLRMQAFGPFWERAEVDFAPVGRQGLFLIHGPVGSGKTTLLDAIAFALYGVSSGGERTPAELRCDLASPELPTEVWLEFAAGDRVWRATRTLEGGELTSADGLEVGLEPERVLGLNALQFRRSAMLPQGQFRQFLEAGADEREQILTALFGNRGPREAQAALAAALLETERELRGRWSEREALGQVEGVALDERLRQLSGELLQSQDRLERWKLQSAELLDNRERATLVGERSRERQRVHALLRELLERRDDMEALKEHAGWLKRARSMAPQVDGWEAARAAEGEAQARFYQAEQDLQARLQALPSGDQGFRDVQKIEAERAELLARQAELRRAEEARTRVEAADERLQRCRRTWAEMQEEGAALREQLEAARARMRQTAELTDEEARLKEQLRERASELERLREAVKGQRQAEELALGIARVQQSLAQNHTRRQRLLDHIDTLETQFNDRLRATERHWAATLAGTVKPGSPCPVCGSLQHPQLAFAEQEGSSGTSTLEGLRKQLDTAWKQAETTETEETEQQIQLGRLEERLDMARERAGNEPRIEASAVSEVTGSLRDLERQLQRLQRGREEGARDERRARKLEEKLARWQEAAAGARATLAQAEALTEERRSLLEGLPDDLEGESEWLEHRFAQLDAEFDQQRTQLGRDTELRASFMAAAEAAHQGIQLSRQRTELAWELVEAKLQINQFASLDEWRRARKEADADLDTVESELRAYEQSLDALESEVERADRSLNESLEDWRELKIDPAQLEEELQAGYRRVAELEKEIARLRERQLEYDALVEVIRELEPRLSALRRLNAVAEGNNPAGQSFAQFVLAQQLSSVLTAANARLAQMSNGRYLLQGGTLELNVLDQLSGRSRGLATLSGGEGFLASLALALGLSDSSGGATLETLFIDEGFGSLDEEGLDQAFRALDSLGSQGRLVGLISHLAEVRARVSTRLEIRPEPGGHKLLWVQ